MKRAFILKLVFKVSVGGRYQHFDEQLRLVMAADREEALNVGREMGDEEAQQFVNTSGEMVEWTFEGVIEMRELTEERHGSLLFSASNYSDDPAGYSRYIRTKAFAISDKNPTFA